MSIDTDSRNGTRQSNSGATTDNRLALMDQAGIQLSRATGRRQVMQIVWVYEHPVDRERLYEFHRAFGYGLAGRRVERSPLPFGRHRWVSALGPQGAIAFSARVRARCELSEWVDERSQVPVDAERGPGWHLGALEMTDGSTAVTLVASHNLGDGVAGLIRVFEAVHGNRRSLGYPAPMSQPRRRAVARDLRETARGLPEVVRVAVAASKMLWRQRREVGAPAPKQQRRRLSSRSDRAVVVPAISVFVDVEHWDSRAEALGGNSYALLAGFAAKLGERMGRARVADGAVTLSIALNDRAGLDDTRAIALAFAKAVIDPGPVTADLSDTRTALRHALKEVREGPDQVLELLPVVPFVPRRILGKVATQFLGSAGELDVYCSNLGDVDAAVGRPAGTDAEYVMLRGGDQNFRQRDMEQAGGQLVVVAGRINGKVSINIAAYQLDSDNSKTRLRDIAADTLAEFGVSCVCI